MPSPKSKLEAKSSGRWRWLLPGDPFHPRKWGSARRNDLCGRCLWFGSEYRKGGTWWMSLFWGVSSSYTLKNRPRDTCHRLWNSPHVLEDMPRSEDFCSSAWPVTGSCTPGRIWHLRGTTVAGLWPISNLQWYFGPFAQVFFLHFTSNHLVWRFLNQQDLVPSSLRWFREAMQRLYLCGQRGFAFSPLCVQMGGSRKANFPVYVSIF